jgi:hypothetical protein
LNQFQGCVADKSGSLRLIRAINTTTATLHEDHVEWVFEKCWADYENALKEATGELQDFLLFFGRPTSDGAVYRAVFADLYLSPVTCKAGDREIELGSIKNPPKIADKTKLPKGIRQLLPYQEVAPVYKLSRLF